MRSPGINGEGELRGQPANPGSPGKWPLKRSVCVCCYYFRVDFAVNNVASFSANVCKLATVCGAFLNSCDQGRARDFSLGARPNGREQGCSWRRGSNPLPPSRRSGDQWAPPAGFGGTPTTRRFSTIFSTLPWHYNIIVNCGLSCKHWKQNPRAPLVYVLCCDYVLQTASCSVCFWFSSA